MNPRLLQQITVCGLAFLLLAGCGTPLATPTLVPSTSTPTSIPPTATPAPPTATPTQIPPTATSTPIPPTSTPTLPPGPKPGHWEGRPSVSFEVTTDGNIRNFSIVVPFGQTTCTLTAEEEFSLGADNTIIFSKLGPSLDKNLLELMVALEIPTPVPIKTDAGELIEMQHISGKFNSPTTITGTFEVLVCEGEFAFSSGQDDKWSAEWKGP
jgi:hypothetical protein